MNKYVLLAGAAVVAFATSASAFEMTPYAALRASWDFTRNNVVEDYGQGDAGKIKLNDGVWGGHIALGAKHGAFRLETEYNFARTARKNVKEYGEKANLKTNSLLVNAYYDINTCSRFTPYVGFGAGLAKLDMRWRDGEDDYTYKQTTSNFAWQVGAGVSYAATDSVDVDFGYRYVDTGAAYARKSYSSRSSMKEKINTARHEIYAGIRYNF